MTTKTKKATAAKPKAAAAKKPRPQKTSAPAGDPAAQAPKPTGGRATPQTLRGMRDIVPSEQRYWRHIYRKVEELTAAYGYERLDTPILEETSLFVRSAGKQSDVVEKEMFSFLDKGNDNVSLRPEGTAPLVRAYVNHGMVNLPQPVKLYYWGPMFRYERPQHGRFRQHHQFGVEVFGDPSPVQDCEVILLAYLFYKELGIKTAIHINSLGCNQCRQGYQSELSAYYRTKRSQLCEDCKRRLAKNPLRLLDCKEASCQPIKEAAPHIVDFLDEECKNHLMRVLEYLDDLQVPYVLDPHLVRGFDYYNRTVFEIMLADESPEAGQTALGGGGRYDNLVEQLGGRPTPACGFGIGVERVILQLKAQQIEPKDERRPDVFLAQLGDQARRKAFMLFEELRAAGVQAAANFSKGALKGQLEIANRLGAKYTVILGQKEVLDGTILIRDMESGMQEIVLYDKAGQEIKKKLGKV
ncbi:MAG TPA: histidine--tRNA ligase [Candidatus Binatia bacterium]|jgi:histidyl-tRNA synthetase|nr:histidine--tRNA ligase [Candidatus Binatia bacterium]